MKSPTKLIVHLLQIPRFFHRFAVLSALVFLIGCSESNGANDAGTSGQGSIAGASGEGDMQPALDASPHGGNGGNAPGVSEADTGYAGSGVSVIDGSAGSVVDTNVVGDADNVDTSVVGDADNVDTGREDNDGSVPEGPADDSELIGFATVADYGLQGTSGAGRNAEVVTVSDFAAFVAAVSDSIPRMVQVSGRISSAGDEMVDIGSNKTIIGIGSDAIIDGFGFDINGWTSEEVDVYSTDTCNPDFLASFDPVSNVIVQNLTFQNAPDDSINIQCYTHHIWVDHNTFHVAGDGSVDIKRGSDLVTVSWNRFINTDKTMLLGHSANNGEQDRGYLRVTYHHNFFDGTATRTPRVRFGYAHVFNNYLNSTDYFLGLGIEASIYSEGNYVERTKTITQTFTESVDYHLTWTETNYYDEATISRAQDSSKTRQDWLDEDGSVSMPTEYTYQVDSVMEVPTLKDAAGAGHL